MKKKKTTIIICILIIVLIALLGTVVYLLLHRDDEPEPESDGVYVMDESNFAQIQSEMDEKVQDGYFETYMNTEWTFEDGTSETQDAILGNSPNNTKPIRCEVSLNDTGEIVFTTEVLPVGAQVPPFKLDTDLDEGRYEATCTIYLMDEVDDGKYQDASSAGFHVVINVLN